MLFFALWTYASRMMPGFQGGHGEANPPPPCASTALSKHPPPPHLLPGMGVSHNVFLRGGTGLTYVCPKLVRAGVLRWRDLMMGGIVRMEHLEQIAYTWNMTYGMGVQDVYISVMSPPNTFSSPALHQ